MKTSAWLFCGALLCAGCAGDNGMTYLSPPQPARSVAVTGATQDLRRSGNRSQFAAGRVYEIARLETASEPRGEWRAVGESIHEHGSQIEFTELGSGKPISFIAPHQVTETDSHSDRRVTQFRHEGPEDDRYTSAPR